MQWLIKIKVILFIYSMNVFPILCNCCILWAWYVHITLWKPNLKWITLGKNIEPFHHIYCSQILCTTSCEVMYCFLLFELKIYSPYDVEAQNIWISCTWNILYWCYTAEVLFRSNIFHTSHKSHTFLMDFHLKHTQYNALSEWERTD